MWYEENLIILGQIINFKTALKEKRAHKATCDAKPAELPLGWLWWMGVKDTYVNTCIYWWAEIG